MFFRILNGVYRHLVLPQFKKRCISGEQFYEEGLVLRNIPQESLMPLTGEEQARVQALFGKIWGAKSNLLKNWACSNVIMALIQDTSLIICIYH